MAQKIKYLQIFIQVNTRSLAVTYYNYRYDTSQSRRRSQGLTKRSIRPTSVCQAPVYDPTRALRRSGRNLCNLLGRIEPTSHWVCRLYNFIFKHELHVNALRFMLLHLRLFHESSESETRQQAYLIASLQHCYLLLLYVLYSFVISYINQIEDEIEKLVIMNN